MNTIWIGVKRGNVVAASVNFEGVVTSLPEEYEFYKTIPEGQMQFREPNGTYITLKEIEVETDGVRE